MPFRAPRPRRASFAVPILLALSTSLLAACSGGGGSSPTEPATPPPPAESSFTYTADGAMPAGSVALVNHGFFGGAIALDIEATELPRTAVLELEITYPADLLVYDTAFPINWGSAVDGLELPPERSEPGRVVLRLPRPTSGSFTGSATIMTVTFAYAGADGNGRLDIVDAVSLRPNGTPNGPLTGVGGGITVDFAP